MLRQYEDVQMQTFLPRTGKFPTTKDPLMSDFIIDPEQISPILKASEARIRALEEEVLDQCKRIITERLL
jgi:hypothetical protein